MTFWRCELSLELGFVGYFVLFYNLLLVGSTHGVEQGFVEAFERVQGLFNVDQSMISIFESNQLTSGLDTESGAVLEFEELEGAQPARPNV